MQRLHSVDSGSQLIPGDDASNHSYASVGYKKVRGFIRPDNTRARPQRKELVCTVVGFSLAILASFASAYVLYIYLSISVAEPICVRCDSLNGSIQYLNFGKQYKSGSTYCCTSHPNHLRNALHQVIGDQYHINIPIKKPAKKIKIPQPTKVVHVILTDICSRNCVEPQSKPKARSHHLFVRNIERPKSHGGEVEVSGDYVTIKTTGKYYISSQFMCQSNTIGSTRGHIVKRHNKNLPNDRIETLIAGYNTGDGPMKIYIAGVFQLNKEDKLFVKSSICLFPDQRKKNYLTLIKLGNTTAHR
ncbi:uncharacterized protein LOC126825409 [Patella vulgata]|uniref:uncharacterized protein LOC126825409 n=1 Tax=Patella vulgata TaxID=6465 RepID=UPI0021800A7B|nr:uncharacterized protein LOC126825409 [Patella vulgata]XP_050411054.1 uncharacterized protein LOC126825409 [Patella vulgata]XP_050411059.1 uncharacterized protein LOC126825409 [Patella vulgata]XP_055956037.1 uncharacterized protein LOC126825409 [Patella vulgata]